MDTAPGAAATIAGMPERPPGHGAEPGFDVSHAHSARVYNYWLGGQDNFAADREAAERAIAANPGILTDVRANREFLARAVRYLASECGIRQFLDVGTGLPTASNIHEVAQAVTPRARVVYADNDPIVLAHAQALLTSTAEGATAYLDADLRNGPAILQGARRTLDFSQPVALMLLIVLHMIADDEDPYGIVATLLGAVPPGSYLALSHVAADIDPDRAGRARDRLNQLAYQQTTMRSHAEVGRFFDGLELVEPGLVQVQEWRSGNTAGTAGRAAMWGGVGR